ncbi:PREDICTED: uncharacterized protein LOC106724174 [Myotis brandtii]|uniref:uncharacterized protein LOC106724174 n=1 Tax=Myotis brandtii TaxID=109478 RepID=UPI00070407A5|nr:PREDICTED: uncharacterized protein LOC106724174 [Myotis brandtii]
MHWDEVLTRGRVKPLRALPSGLRLGCDGEAGAMGPGRRLLVPALALLCFLPPGPGSRAEEGAAPVHRLLGDFGRSRPAGHRSCDRPTPGKTSVPTAQEPAPGVSGDQESYRTSSETAGPREMACLGQTCDRCKAHLELLPFTVSWGISDEAGRLATAAVTDPPQGRPQSPRPRSRPREFLATRRGCERYSGRVVSMNSGSHCCSSGTWRAVAFIGPWAGSGGEVAAPESQGRVPADT